MFSTGRDELLVRAMGHQGLAMLRILYAGSLSSTGGLYNRIREKVDAIPLRAIEVMPEYDDSGKPKHVGWYSMAHDVLCVVGHD